MLIHQTATGAGREFSDGEDALWALPADPLTDVADPADVDTVYAHLDARRTRILRALRHHYAKSTVGVARDGSGTWAIVRGLVSSAVDVGRPVTEALLRGDDDLAALRSLLAGGIARKASERRLLRCLADEREPADLPYEEGEIKFPDSPADVLAMSGLCAALDAVPDDPADADELTDAMLAGARRAVEGPIARALQHMAGRLADVSASLELTDGSLALEFADGHDALRVRPRSRRLAKLVRRLGPEGAGDELADRYRRLDLRRRRTVAALLGALREGGYVQQHTVGGCWIGRRHRAFKLDLGRRLTAGVEVRGEARTLRDALPEALAERAVALLGVADDLTDLPHRPLPIAPPTDARLSDAPLTAAEISRADAAAEAVLAALRSPADPRQAYEAASLARDPLAFDPAVDDWHRATDRWPEVRRQFEGAPPHHEADGIGLLYAHRCEAPGLARAWLAGEWIDCYRDELCRAGDPRALRPLAVRLERGPDPDDLAAAADCDVPTLLHMVGPTTAARLREVARVEVGGDLTGAWADALRLARRAGWAEVGGALVENPALAAAVVTPGEGWDGRPAHPLFDAGCHVLAWSLVRPNARLARLLAGGLAVDWAAEHEAAARRIIGPSDDRWREAAGLWSTSQTRPLAVAWRRCRRAGVAWGAACGFAKKR